MWATVLLLLLAWATGGAQGDAGGALLFDGVDDYAAVFPGFQLSSQWTIEAWVRPSALPPSDAAPVGSGRSGSCLLGLQTMAGANLLTVAATSSGTWTVAHSPDLQGIPHSGWSGGPAGLYTTDPHHFSLTQEFYSSSIRQMRLYLNGTLRATWLVAARVVREPALPLLLGACHAAGESGGERGGGVVRRERFFNGALDEVRWWSVALTGQEVAEMWRWTGRIERWPTPAGSFHGATGYAAEVERLSSLWAQYSLDLVLGRELADGAGLARGGAGRLGYRGEAAEAPEFVKSPFASLLSFGTLWFEARGDTDTTVDLAPEIYFIGSPTYNGLLINRTLSQGAARLRTYGGTGDLTAGSVSPGLVLSVVLAAGSTHDSFVVQPCAGPPSGAPLLANCTAGRHYEVTVSVVPSRSPIAGPSYAVQLLRGGGFLELPRLPATAMVEAWVRLSPPLVRGASIFSVQGERPGPALDGVVLWLDPGSGGAVLEMCRQGSVGPARLAVPRLCTTEPQHLALFFELVGASAAGHYNVKVFQNGQPVLDGRVDTPCFALDSPLLGRPTLGQRYRPEEPEAPGGAMRWSGDFASMFLAELRIWDRWRPVAGAMRERLLGNESGLFAYAPVLHQDEAAVAVAEAEATAAAAAAATVDALLLAAAVPRRRCLAVDSPAPPREVPLESRAGAGRFALRCAEEYGLCPRFAAGEGFAVRPSVFDLPPEAAAVWTTAGTDVLLDLVSLDPDNFREFSEEVVDRDSVRFEILEFPDPVCGLLHKNGVATAVPVVDRWPPTEVVYTRDLPLRFAPFAGATILEQRALGDACSTSLAYVARDSTNRRSTHPARLVLSVLRAGVRLLSAVASSPSSAELGVAGVVRLAFSNRTSQPSMAAAELLDIVNGSWGSPPPTLRWSDGGATLWLRFPSNSSSAAGASLLPGFTAFRVREAAGMRIWGDALSAPSSAESPPLEGSFSLLTCEPGYLFDAEAGACSPCPPGTFWSMEGPSCIHCPTGHINASYAALGCGPCGPGEYANTSTSCVDASAGEFVPPSAEPADATVPCMSGAVAEEEGSSECEVCPRGAVCEAPAVALALPGHARTSAGTFVRCRVPSACLGANRCIAGAQDPGSGCYRCAAGYARASGDAGSCARCPEKWRAALELSLALGLTVALALLMAVLNIGAARRPSCLHAYVLKIGLGYLFMMRACNSLEEWELELGFGNVAQFAKLVLDIALCWGGVLPARVVPIQCLVEQVAPGIPTRDRLGVIFAFWALLPLALPLAAVLFSWCLLQLYRCLHCVDAPRRKEAPHLDAIVPVGKPVGKPEALAKPAAAQGAWQELVGHVGVAWEAVWDFPTAQYYYFNRDLKISTWQRPQAEQIAFDPLQIAGGACEQVLRHELLERRAFGIWRLPSASVPAAERLRAFLTDTAGVVLACWYLTYPTVVQQLLAFARCDTLGGEARLLMEPSLRCDAALGVAGVVAAALWGFGLPALTGWLCWRACRAGALARFAARVSLGVVSAEYESSYFYWEAVLMLRRFAVVCAVGLTHAAPRPVRLVLLLAIGQTFLFMQKSNRPFDDRCGLLLDELEERALQTFCAMSAVMLLSMSNIVHPYACATLLMVVMAAHLHLLVRLAMHFLRFARRSAADHVIEMQLQGKTASRLRQWIFRQDLVARNRRAQVHFDSDRGAVAIRPGLSGAHVTDEEQLFLAHALAGGFERLLVRFKADRIAVETLEFLARGAFASNLERRQCETATLNGKGGCSTPHHASGEERRNLLFEPATFQLGLHASDFQQAVQASYADVSGDHFEHALYAFLHRRRGGRGHFDVPPIVRMLRHYDRRPATGSPGAPALCDVPVPREEEEAPKVPVTQAAALCELQDLDDEDEVQSGTMDTSPGPGAAFAAAELLLQGRLAEPPRPEPPRAEAPVAMALPTVGAVTLPGQVECDDTDDPDGGGNVERVAAPAPAPAAVAAPAVAAPAVVAPAAAPPAAAAPADAPSDDSMESAAASVLQSIRVVPWSVTGLSSGARAAPEPGERTAVVDAAMLPTRALGDARFQRHGKLAMIHVSAPDLEDETFADQEDAVTELLATAYRNVFREFSASNCTHLRLAPICEGELSGPFEASLPALTAAAIWRAQQALTSREVSRLRGLAGMVQLELCASNARRCKEYSDAMASAAG